MSKNTHEQHLAYLSQLAIDYDYVGKHQILQEIEQDCCIEPVQALLELARR